MLAERAAAGALRDSTGSIPASLNATGSIDAPGRAWKYAISHGSPERGNSDTCNFSWLLTPIMRVSL